MRWMGFLMAMAILGSCAPRVNGEIARACMAGGRDAANPQLCNCIGVVASRTLSGSDQRQLISFFGDPERANDIKINDSRGADAFWERYRAFTNAAERSCR